MEREREERERTVGSWCSGCESVCVCVSVWGNVGHANANAKAAHSSDVIPLLPVTSLHLTNVSMRVCVIVVCVCVLRGLFCHGFGLLVFVGGFWGVGVWGGGGVIYIRTCASG